VIKASVPPRFKIILRGSDMDDKLILALDVKDKAEALAWPDRLHDRVGFFKIGKQLFTSTGPAVVREIIHRGGSIFLDLKFHDIPNTVAAAAVEAVRLGVRMFNLHALGGYEMMARAAESRPSTILMDRIGARYSVAQSSSVAT